jgi:fluoride exporter
MTWRFFRADFPEAAASRLPPFRLPILLGHPCGDRELAAKPAASRVIPSCRSGKAEMNYLLVFIGGGLGSTLRHIVNVVSPRLLGTAFPYHTFIINITGSIVMGLIAGYLAFKGEASQPWRLFLMTGVLGGYTTFSAFSLDAVLLYERGAIGLALFYVLGSVVFSIAGLFASLALVRHFT